MSFPLFISPTESVGFLRTRIWNVCAEATFRGASITNLVLYKVDDPIDGIGDRISRSTYCPAGDAPVLSLEWTYLSEVWAVSPPDRCLHIFACISPRQGDTYGTAMLLYNALWGVDLGPRLGLPDLGFDEKVLLIREEYKTAISLLQEPSTGTGGVAITGQPGIGKTCFIYYLLLRRLSERRPTALQLPHKALVVVFQEGGCTVLPETGDDQHSFADGTWALSGDAAPCDTFLGASVHRRIWIVHATSPAASQYAWIKKHRGFIYVMMHFSDLEFLSLAKALGVDGNTLLKYSEKWGPSARLCLRLLKNERTLEGHIATVQDAAAKFAAKFPLEMDFSAVDVSHTLFAVRPQSPDICGREIMVAEVATKDLNQFIAEATADADSRRQYNFYTMISGHPHFRSSAGYMFERFFFYAWIYGMKKSTEIDCFPSPEASHLSS
ncbi:hypothetical protein BC827DRAFT_1269212 [Russula dissimulans]|nr:hypothetical protein BC827DRAFT_1269212 [Russula dissimulans]